jgi:hypothetical protein
MKDNKQELYMNKEKKNEVVIAKRSDSINSRKHMKGEAK